MKKSVFCTALCVMQYAAYGVFNAVPGDQIWVMVDQIGRTNQAIKGFATPITNADLPLNITVSGRYAAVEPLSYTPSNATDYPITIDADNVHLTLNGYILTVGNKTASSLVVMNGRNNISIVDGGINGGDNVFFMGNHNGITLDNLSMNDCGTGTAGDAAFTIAGGSSNIHVNNIRENGQQNSDGLFIQNCTNIRVRNSSFDNNLRNAIVITQCQHATVENIIANQTNLNGITIGTSTDIYVTDCSVAALSAGQAPIAYNILEGSEQIVLNNCSSAGNGSNSIGLMISTSTAVSCNNFHSYNDQYGIQQTDATLITVENSLIELAGVNGILFNTAADNITLQNVDIVRPTGVAILGDTGNNCIFKNINLFDLNANGIEFNTLANFVLKNSSMTITSGNVGNSMIFITDTSNAVFKNNTLLANGVSGGMTLSTMSDTCILDSNISESIAFGINIGTSSNFVISNCTVNNNLNGLVVADGTAFAIRNCTVDFNTESGINLGNAQLGVVTHNNVNFNNQLMTSTGIIMSGCNRCYVGFNTIALMGTGSGSGTLGISESGFPGSNAFFGNMIQNYAAGTGGGASTVSFYTFSPFHCNPNVPVNDPVPDSHWENLQIIYN